MQGDDTRRAACRSSGRIQHLAAAEDCLATKWIGDGGFLHQVNVAAKDRLELLNHVDPFKEAPRCVLGKFNHDIDIAVRAEIITQDGAEERELNDLPFEAESLRPRLFI